MAGRPKKEDSRDKQYRVRLNEKEDEMLEYASNVTGKQKSEIFRQALVEYYEKVRFRRFTREKNYNDDMWEMEGISLKRIVDCPYCGSSNAVDLDEYCSETVDEDMQMGEETTYSFDIDNFECDGCHKKFGINGFICEYPQGVFNYEEINTKRMDG